MSYGLRSPLGALVFLVGFVAYVFGAYYVAVTWLPESKLIQLAYYVAAGLAWTGPALLLIRWIYAPRALAQQEE